jgi:hypothetical protein
MSLLWFEGAETFDIVTNVYDLGTGQVGVGFGRYGTRGSRSSAGAGASPTYLEKNQAVGSEYIQQMAFLSNSSSGNVHQLFGTREVSTRHLDVVNTSAGNILVRRNGTTLYTLTGAGLFGVWHYIEMKAKIHASTGYIILRLDGVELLNVTGINTSGGLTATPDRHFQGQLTDSSTNINFQWDDYVLIKIDGTAPNDFIGDCRVTGLFPNGAGSSTDFTPSAGSNYQNVDDFPFDDDTTYNSSPTVGAVDTFAMSNLPAAGDVYGVRQFTRVRKDDAGSRSACHVVRVDGTEYPSSSFALSDTYITFHQLLATNPDTGVAWTDAEVNALEAGYEVVT